MKKLLFIFCFVVSFSAINAQSIDSLKVEQAILKDSVATLQVKVDAIQAKLDVIPEGWNTFGKITLLINQTAFLNWQPGGDAAFAGFHQYRAGAGCLGCLDITQGITDSRYIGEVGMQTPADVMQHAGCGLAAIAVIIRPMRAIRIRVDHAAGIAHLAMHGFVSARPGL